MAIFKIDADPASIAPEHRGFYAAIPSAHQGVVISGTAGFRSQNHILVGNEDDQEFNTYNIRLLVGPFWRHVSNVVPKVTVDAVYSSNPDEDDRMSWSVSGLKWEPLGDLGPNNDLTRIRLRFRVDVKGEELRVVTLGYWLMASGRRLGDGGLNDPGPVHAQPSFVS